jgi:hypothetical protein
MRIMLKKDNEIDPEFLDLIIQSLLVLSKVATIASTWIVLRNRPPASHPGGFADADSIRQQIRILRRGLEDTFESVEAVLQILEEARVRLGGADPLIQPTRFGTGAC